MVKTFTGKANLWNQLKELGFDSKQLKSQYSVSYQQANVYLLYDILEQLQKEVGTGVNENLSSACDGVTGNDINASNTSEAVETINIEFAAGLVAFFNTEITEQEIDTQVSDYVASVNQSQVNYIVVTTDYPQVVIKDDYTTKYLTEVTEQQLVDSLYTDKFTAEVMFPGSYYQVLEVNPVNIHQQLMKYYNLETTCTTVATETSGNITPTLEQLNLLAYELRMYCDYAKNRPTLSPVLCKNGSYYHNYQESILVFDMDSLNIWSFENEVKSAEFLRDTAKLRGMEVKLANHYLATEDEQIKQAIASNIPHQYAAVLGGQQQKQVTVSEPLPGSVVLSPKHYLKPKLYLFAAMTEFVFLMECYLDLIGYFFSSNSFTATSTYFHVNLSEISSQLYFSWCSLTAICFKRYVLMPTIGSNNHTKLLLIHLEATTGYKAA